MHLWEADGEHQIVPYENKACIEDEDSYLRGLNGENLKPTSKWYYQ